MKLEHKFSVPAGLDTVWRALQDPELVAPCMPGATLTNVDGAEFAGTVKVKLGPISLLYKGAGEFLEQDEDTRRLVIKAAGKDARGNGTAAATVTVTLAAASESATDGTVHTDLNITGRPAQLGRGMISEVGGKILDTFAGNLATKLADGNGTAATAGPEAVADADSPKTTDERPAEPEATARPKLSVVNDSAPEEEEHAAPSGRTDETEAIDLLGFAGPSVMKRLAPVLIVGILVLLVVVFRRRSR